MSSLKKRYAFKLTSSFFGVAASALVQALVPRGLGPQAYGDFNYLSNFFTQITAFLDMGTSIGFYTKLSQRPRDSGLVAFYLGFAGLASAAVLGLSALTYFGRIRSLLWPNQEPRFIAMAALFGVLLWLAQILTKMADAYGLTVSSETAKMLQKVLGMIAILTLFHWGRLDLKGYFYYQCGILLFLIAAYLWINERSGHSLRTGPSPSAEDLKGYAAELYHYSHPLFVYSVAALVIGLLNRWLLEVFGGSVQQGFFGLSTQIGALCFLFTSAMTPLLMREFSIAHEKKDLPLMASLFRKHIPLLYGITAYFSCFVAVQADRIIYIMGGKGYEGARVAVALMALAPIHQTYGQLSGSVFYATGETRLYRDIGIAFMLIGLPVGFFLLAPRRYWGLNGGATGLAAGTLVMQFLAVNAQLYFNAKYLQLSFLKYLAHQIICATVLLALAWTVGALVDRTLRLEGSMVAGFLVAGIVYTTATAALIWRWPILFGLRDEHIQLLRDRIMNPARLAAAS